MASIPVDRDRRAALGLWVVTIATLATPGMARADGWSLRLEPGYSATRTTTTAEGVTAELDATALQQKYGLTLDQTLWPLVRLGAGGILDWTQGTVKSPGRDDDVDTKNWSGYARLDAGGPTARGGAGYDRRDEASRRDPRDGSASTSSRLINEVITAWATLKPEGLPSADLRLSRTNSRDADRLASDQQTDEFLLNSIYAPVPVVDLRYTLRATDKEDRISNVETLQVNNLVRGAYQDSFLQRRLSVYVSADATRVDTHITVSGVGGLVSQQQFPIRGLSAVEVFPTPPERTVLDPNPALIDSNVATSAGIDVGFSRSVPTDNRPRHMGVQFADVVTPVNRVFVWVDRQLTPEVANAYAAPGRWSAFQSDDNMSWTPVAVGPVVFGVFDNRFEITIAETRARYLEVVTTPLPAGVTFDQQFASVFVTELQAYVVRPAADVQGRHGSTQGNLSSAMRYELASVKGLSYDLATSVRYATQASAVTTWLVANGLNYLRPLSAALLLSARLDRTDADEGRGHEAGTRYSVTLGATPVPAFTASATVNGGYEQSAAENRIRNAILGTATAELYRGVAVTATGSASHLRSDTGRTSLVLESRSTLSLVPHRTLSMSGTFASSDTRTEGGSTPEAHEAIGRVEATASFTPFQALYLSGSVIRFLYGPEAPDLLSTLGVTFSPLPGAPLLLRFNYQETLDTGQELKTRIIAPGLRWNIRPRWYVDVTYSRLDSSSPTVETRSRVFFASLFAIIGR